MRCEEGGSEVFATYTLFLAKDMLPECIPTRRWTIIMGAHP